MRKLIGDYFEVQSADSDRYFETWSTIDDYKIFNYKECGNKNVKLKSGDLFVNGIIATDLQIFVIGHKNNKFSIRILDFDKLICDISDALNNTSKVNKLCDLLDNYDEFDDDLDELIEKLKNI